MNNFRLLSALRGDGTYPRSLRSILVGYGIDGVDKDEEREALREKVERAKTDQKYSKPSTGKFSKKTFYSDRQNRNNTHFPTIVQNAYKAFKPGGPAWSAEYSELDTIRALLNFMRGYALYHSSNYNEFVNLLEEIVTRVTETGASDVLTADNLAATIIKSEDKRKVQMAQKTFQYLRDDALKHAYDYASFIGYTGVNRISLEGVKGFICNVLVAKSSTPEALVHIFNRFRDEYHKREMWYDMNLFSTSLAEKKTSDDAEDLDDVVRIVDDEDYVPSDEERPPPAKRPPQRVDDDDDDFEEPAIKRRA